MIMGVHNGVEGDPALQVVRGNVVVAGNQAQGVDGVTGVNGQSGVEATAARGDHRGVIGSGRPVEPD